MLPGLDYTGISVVFYCHDGNNNFLFQKRSQHCRDQKGTWDCGGGKLEFGESPQEALMRELKEEYGCSGQIEIILPPISFLEKFDQQDKHWIVLPHIVRVNREEVKICDERSIEEIGWFKLASLPQPLHISIKKELELYGKYFDQYRSSNNS